MGISTGAIRGADAVTKDENGDVQGTVTMLQGTEADLAEYKPQLGELWLCTDSRRSGYGDGANVISKLQTSLETVWTYDITTSADLILDPLGGAAATRYLVRNAAVESNVKILLPSGATYTGQKIHLAILYSNAQGSSNGYKLYSKDGIVMGANNIGTDQGNGAGLLGLSPDPGSPVLHYGTGSPAQGIYVEATADFAGGSIWQVQHTNILSGDWATWASNYSAWNDSLG